MPPGLHMGGRGVLRLFLDCAASSTWRVTQLWVWGFTAPRAVKSSNRVVVLPFILSDQVAAPSRCQRSSSSGVASTVWVPPTRCSAPFS